MLLLWILQCEPFIELCLGKRQQKVMGVMKNAVKWTSTASTGVNGCRRLSSVNQIENCSLVDDEQAVRRRHLFSNMMLSNYYLFAMGTVQLN